MSSLFELSIRPVVERYRELVFSSKVSCLADDIGKILDVDRIDWTIGPDYDAEADMHLIGINLTKPDVLNDYHINWNPVTLRVTRDRFKLAPDFRGQGLGTAITKRTIEFARSLGAKSFAIESINNLRWHRRLLQMGFIQAAAPPFNRVFLYFK